MSVEQLMYTALPRGKGLNPASSGYQVKAVSPGLSQPIIQILSGVCMHYGEVVYRGAPPEAMQKEMAWRTQTTDLDHTPSEVLEAFPVIWSYDRLGTDLVSLTRVSYRGLTHDRRPGNFFAHSLVFDPCELKEWKGNPLALALSGLFCSVDESDRTKLPSLPNLGQPSQPVFMKKPFTDPQYAAHIGLAIQGLLDSLSGKTTRPLLVCLPHWQMGVDWIEDLLQILPSSIRSKVTFTSLETDRLWKIPGTNDGPPHHLIIMVGADERSFNLRPDEIASRFCVLNFVGQQFSETHKLGLYAQFAADCVDSDQMQALDRYHHTLEIFRMGTNPEAWDQLTFVGRVGGGAPDSIMLLEALEQLSHYAQQPDQALAAVDWLMPYICSAAETHATDQIRLFHDGFHILLARMPQAQATERLDILSNLAEKALQAGYVQTAKALFDLLGSQRTLLLTSAVNELISRKPDEWHIPSAQADRNALLALLLEAFSHVESNQNLPLIKAIFRTAEACGQTASIWEQIGESTVIPALEGTWTAEKDALCRALSHYLASSQVPEAEAWLRMKRLQNSVLDSDQLVDQLRDTAKYVSQSPRWEQPLAQLLDFTKQRFKEQEGEVLILGLMGDATMGTPAGKKLLHSFREACKNFSDKDRLPLLRKLAKYGAVDLLCEEYLAEILPWNTLTSPRIQQRWQDVIFSHHPSVLDAVRLRAAQLFSETEQLIEILPLVNVLLPKNGHIGQEPGLLALYNSMLVKAPFDPFKSIHHLPETANGLSVNAAARLSILRFLERLMRDASQADWSLAVFPSTDPAWSVDVRTLSEGERRRLIQSLLDHFQETGITQPEHVRGLVKMVNAVGENSFFPEAFSYLLKGRGSVTWVIAMNALFQYGIKSGRPEIISTHARQMVETVNPSTRRLLEEYLVGRFTKQDAKLMTQLVSLAEQSGLHLAVKPIEKKTDVKVQTTQSGDQLPDDSGGSLSEVVDKGRKMLSSLFGKSDASSTNDKPGANPKEK